MNNQKQSNKNNKPEDIFAEVDSSPTKDEDKEKKQEKINKKEPKESTVDNGQVTDSYNKKEYSKVEKKSQFFDFSKINWTYIVIFLIIALGLGLVIKYYGSQVLMPNLNIGVIFPEKIVGNNQNIERINDADGDGLSNSKEESLGTDLFKKDTDQDGLFDKEEVEVYSTNPLEPDTDGDGKNDGWEVENGFDPNDSDPNAKLLDLNKEINNK